MDLVLTVMYIVMSVTLYEARYYSHLECCGESLGRVNLTCNEL